MLSVQNDGDQTCGKRHFPSFRCVGFSDCRHRLPDSRLLTIRLWSTCTRKFSKAWERWIFSGRWPAMVASKRFFHRSPKMWQMQNSPELRPFCVCLFYAIYNVVFSMTANSHPAQARLIGSPESQGLNKSQVFWNLTRLQEKKQTIYILKHSFVETVILAHLTTTLATLDIIQPKNPTKDIEKHFPPAWRIAVWPVKKHKTLSLEKPYPPHLNGANVYLPILNGYCLGGKGRQTQIPCIECVGMAKPYKSQIEGSFGYWFST